MAKRDLVKLLVKLYGDPKLRERLKKNPKTAMKSGGLSVRERDLFASGDEGRIKAYLGKESPPSIIIQAPSIIIRSATGKLR